MKVFRQLLRPLLAGRLWQRQLTVREVPNMLEYLQEVLLLLTNSRPAFNHDDAHDGSFCIVTSLVPCDDSRYQDWFFCAVIARTMLATSADVAVAVFAAACAAAHVS